MKMANVAEAAGVVELLEGQRGATFIGFTAETEPKMRKRGNPYAGRVRKVAKVSGQIDFHYDGAVLRQLAKEGKDASCFFAGESWHEPVIRADGTLTPFCRHKQNGQMYLRFRLLAVSEVRYVLDSGEDVSKETLEPWLEKASEYKNQGTDEPIRFLVYKLENIKELTVDSETHRL
jgi:hypothetical protein